MNTNEVLRKLKHSPAVTLGRLLGFDGLLPLHDRWIKETWDTKGSHGLMAFRGSYKTSSVVITGIIRYLLFKPDSRILIIRKTFTKAAEVLKTISRAFDKPEIRALFSMIHGIEPEKILDAKSAILFNFKQNSTPEPSLLALGIGNSITGTHADVIIADDIIGLEDKTSDAEREKVKDYARELAGNIIDPDSLSIWLGTKWHENDAWEVIGSFTEIKKYPLSEYNFFPESYIEEKKKRLTPFLFSINYELKITSDDDAVFKNPKWGVFDRDSFISGKVYAHIDAAYGGEDTCALTVISGNNIIGFLYPGNVSDWYSFIKKQYEYYQCSVLLMESNADKGYLAKDLRALGIKCRTYHESMNKQIKISTFLYAAWEDLIWDAETDPEYMNQILDWTYNTKNHDDAPDSAASLFAHGYKKRAARTGGQPAVSRQRSRER